MCPPPPPPPPPPPSLVTIFRTFVGGLGNSGAASDDGGCGGESGAVDPVIRICLRRTGAARVDRGGEEGNPGQGGA